MNHHTKLTPGHNLLWESSRMMLPEHKVRIRQHQKELAKQNKPQLDEQEIALFARKIADAQHNQRCLQIERFHSEQNDILTGTIQTIIPRQELKLRMRDETHWIAFTEIMNVTLL